jgi:hypothetical protein
MEWKEDGAGGVDASEYRRDVVKVEAKTGER